MAKKITKTVPTVSRWRFMKDDDGHTYLITANQKEKFIEWVEAAPYWGDYEGPDFNEDRIDSEHSYSFTDPQED